MRAPSRAEPELVLVDPPSGVNVNLPNMDVAFAATVLNAPVMDLRTSPLPAGRQLELRARRVAISCRSFTVASAARLRRQLQRRRPDLELRDLHGPVDVQCCYPFVRQGPTVRVELPFGDQLPLPNYELFDSFGLLRACWRSGLWAYAVLTSLGCPHGCSFCAARRRRWRPRSAEHVAGELARARRDWGIASFEVIDDAFNVSRHRVLEFCRLVQPLGLPWACTNGLRADRFDEQQARAMAAAGCVHVGFGVESVDDGVLDRLHKGETFAEIQRAVTLARCHLPRVSGFFVIGLPGSTRELDLAAVRWADRAGIDAVFSLFLPAGARDHVFYGAAATPLGTAYPAAHQLEAYHQAKRLKRGRYRQLLTGGRLLRQGLGALRGAGWPGRANLLAITAGKLPGMLLRGEIQ